jgi:hypothetical protein
MSGEEKVKSHHCERSRASSFRPAPLVCWPASTAGCAVGGPGNAKKRTVTLADFAFAGLDHARRAGKPPVAIGDQCVGVMRSRDLPWSIMACRYSAQSGCSPEIERK